MKCQDLFSLKNTNKKIVIPCSCDWLFEGWNIKIKTKTSCNKLTWSLTQELNEFHLSNSS